ncbi:MAG: NifB/NifX family molybdenum-iron cluster-binding protein [Candidatus Heimdallarchaeaceae archaeon]|nr:MAG: dinitrogenase iron-molybdenum cofactor biosynthesis protein [Candidatus Pacearchaeota archaeon]
MKYAIPVEEDKGWDSPVSAHFGRAPLYVIWDEESNELKVIDNASNHFGGVGMPAEFLAKHSNAILCGGIGSRAIQLAEELNLGVYVGAEGTVKNVIENLKEGKLRLASKTDGCGHGYHDHDHEH